MESMTDFDKLPLAVELDFDEATDLIDLTLYEHIRPPSLVHSSGSSSSDSGTSSTDILQSDDEILGPDNVVPLKLQYAYKPQYGFAPLHEVTEGRNERIKQHYWRLWGLDTPSTAAQTGATDQDGGMRQGFSSLSVDAEFIGDDVYIDHQDVQRFCRVVGNAQQAYRADASASLDAKGKSREIGLPVPMDFAMKLGWKSLMTAIFPQAIDGDLLRLVHLSNAFSYLSDTIVLRTGDTVNSSSRISKVVNSDSGKVVTVTGTIFLKSSPSGTLDDHTGSVPVVEVESSFLYRGNFDDFAGTFESRKETNYALTFKSAQDVAVLKSKEWFEWLDDSVLLTINDTLTFEVESDIRFKTKASFASLDVTGFATALKQVSDGRSETVKVAEINYVSAGTTKGNPVLEYLKRHGQALHQPVPLVAPYALAGPTSEEKGVDNVFKTPASNQAYSDVSGDVNPIHVNPYFSDLAQLPAPITHGMATSAMTRRFVETIAAENQSERVRSFQASFTGMVLPSSKLRVDLKHVAQQNGNKIISVATVDTETEQPVLVGQASVAQARTCYVFTGQGSQEQNMGMDLYASSPVARAVWDAADTHLGDVYGFSIIDIVKNNPKELTVHFGGLKGHQIRQRYMEMTYHSTDKSGQVQVLPLFADIDLRTSRYVFSSPTGLLSATQFTQVALVVTEKAYFEDLRAKGLVQPDCPFAGHSLGEYSALASIANALPIHALVDVVFYRGITMQRAVERDHLNRSQYGMMAVNPSRVGPTFTDPALREVVTSVAEKTGRLVEIVNLNVEGQQSVVAGELVALHTLTNVLNLLKMQKIDIWKLMEQMSLEDVREKLGEIVQECWTVSLEKQEKEGYIHLQRGFATIPLPGIDVPFHSRYLWAGVMPFRTYLSKKLKIEDLKLDLLVGRYIPNLVATPFEVTKEYAERIHTQTASPPLEKILKNWEKESWGSDEKKPMLGYTILVELLAYQFASPVRWIETQDLLFQKFKFERLVEIGPGPTLTGMASRTLKLKYEAQDAANGLKRHILSIAKNQKEIYYSFEDEPEVAEAAPTPTSAPVVAVPAAAAPVAAAPAASTAAAAEIPDQPLKAVETLRAIIAQKLKKPIGEVPLSKAIKDLVGGKSTLQNEILGDLQGEFSSAPEKGEELPLEELGAALGVGYGGSLGKHTSGLVSRMVSSKLPGGFGISNTRGHLAKQWGLGPGRTDGALLVGITMEPAKRLGSEAEAKAWLDSVAQAYAQQAGISLSAPGASAGGGGGSGGAVVDSEALKQLQASQDEFVSRQVEVLLRYLKRDSRDGHRLNDISTREALALQSQLDAISREHGDFYISGIQPTFNPLKARHFNSAFNWVRQDALSMFFDVIYGRLTTVDRDVTRRCLIIMNRADRPLIEYFKYHLDRVDVTKGETYQMVKEFGTLLLQNCEEVIGTPPVYKDVTFPTAPRTTIDERGNIVYEEVPRPRVSRLEKYVAEMAAGTSAQPQVDLEKVHETLSSLYRLVKSNTSVSKAHLSAVKQLYGEVVKTLGESKKAVTRPTGSARARRNSNSFLRPEKVNEPVKISSSAKPLLFLNRKVGNTWQYSERLTSLYLDILKEIATAGTTFEHKTALLTGVGRDSIGVEVVKGLLSGGARVIVTTSSYRRETVEYYQSIYQEVGSRGSSLTVVPFNGGSKQDVEALVEYIYTDMAIDLDYVLPFAALSENGREIDGIDDRSELAHRLMMTNLVRLLGAIKAKKASRRFITRPTEVVLPLSPNHGLFGGDGLYSESKIALETLFNRWSSESWGTYLCIAGAVIGWTRGTGLMAPTNMISEEIEKHGCRTFSAKEMAFNILGLMHPLVMDITQVEPIWADFGGGMSALNDLHILTTRIRNSIKSEADTRRAVSIDNSFDFKIINGVEAESMHKRVNIQPRAHFQLPFPELKPTFDGNSLSELRGVIDLDKVIVCTGFGEVGPFGGSRTRWESEVNRFFSIEGLLELAFVMGLITHFDGKLKSGQSYVGWVDTKTQEPIDDKDVRAAYEKHIIEHTGIRMIEPELFKGYDPKRKGFTQEIELNHDLEPIETSPEDAEKFVLEHGAQFVDSWTEGDRCFVKFKKGAKLFVPKALRFDRLVAGQIPTGWDATVFGIPADIISQVDRTALWALVSVAEALLSSGITDPYELYKYVHPSEVGSSLGSGMGGMQSLSSMFRERREERDVQKDILQETFINTVAGWVNLLLLSSSGPIKIPVGACATALQSVEIACDTILSGKAKVMIAGGYDDFSEEGSYEFANMQATSNTETELASGREPNEMSRPMTSTRSGFMESQGCGVQILMSASTAIKMGATIYGVVAYTATATDKAGRSIPAPGRGVLSTAREASSSSPSMLLDLKYRKRQLAFRRGQISQWLDNELNCLEMEKQGRSGANAALSTDDLSHRMTEIEREASRQEAEAVATYGMLEGADPSIAPLRRALAVWNMTIDDVGVASLHGTSTKANDKNESEVYNSQFQHLGRTVGNACPVISQKWLTGHPKGGAAAWMLNGLAQSINSGIIPGNRNADNIAPEMQAFEFLVYHSKSIQTTGIKSGLLTSFGFGQVGGQCLVLHPDYLLATLDQSRYDVYKTANATRKQQSYKKFNDMFTERNLVVLKEAPPYTPDLEKEVLLNPLARVEPTKLGSYAFTAKSVRATLASQVEGVDAVGTDVEVIADFAVDNDTFIERNFTSDEIAYCHAAPDSKASFTGRWAAKEAVFKAMGVKGKGAGSALKDIEIIASETGPQVKLTGDAALAASERGFKTFSVSISHTDGVAVSVAMGQR
ncbi:uncharacterized protein L969DRAFT_45497 [Mixia osmundae IAM 14324]|uniref:Uncharacterized protein n=1 Tax=Mixia osmundae (strain CBS 9802 / IAM 14324 / JCM 22182 / KY 12970) TaxID=764103 RepID=G7DY64_MIXOS|nr:uncharacterized protein L969DRAFT_45497 [Mixia osmundae IAM 14324]KEI41426.1 hypothetical protein L969DRAFT_45497 [Mixia osmundae IAM 14324]GAA95524.1 hypothetical protein E5Q_02179 [Mixia osmundae IAM 14324]